MVVVIAAAAVHKYCLHLVYTYMYVEGVGQKSGPCTATFNDLLCFIYIYTRHAFHVCSLIYSLMTV
jgi:hypothetical protein